MIFTLNDLLENNFRLRQVLAQVLSPEAIDYILKLIALDNAHRKYLQLVEDSENVVK